MWKSTKCLFLFALYVGFSSGSVNAAENLSPDEYYQLLDSTERSFVNNDLKKMSNLVIRLRNAEAIEVPNYEFYFFEAIINLENGKKLEGKKKLNEFKIMLLIDSGHIDCSELEDGISYEVIRSNMCAEYFYSYYKNASKLAQEKILLYWHLMYIAERRYGLN